MPVAEEEARKRSEYMQAQRDKLVAAKKREREQKVAAENARLGRQQQPAEKVGEVGGREWEGVCVVNVMLKKWNVW